MDSTDAAAFLEEYCEFGEDRVYLLVAVARSKENPGLTSGTEVTVREVLGDRGDVRPTYEAVRCWARGYRTDSGDGLAFRLYVTVNARNALDAYFAFRERTDGWVRDRLNGDAAAPPKFKRVDRYWKSELQRPTARDDRRFLFDLDDVTGDEAERLVGTLREHTTVVTRRPTPNGVHVVTGPFNHTELATDVDYELKTDGLLFLERLTGGDTDR